jgi:ribonuclease HI
MNVVIYTDGGSRGNPGPAGVGAVIEYDGQSKEFCRFIGNGRTNNEAEYEALIFALKNAKKLFGKSKSKKMSVKCYSDSELMVRQLNHQYKLKEERIQKYFIEIWNLTLDFKEVKFFHIPRGMNKRADKLANEAMDTGR